MNALQAAVLLFPLLPSVVTAQAVRGTIKDSATSRVVSAAAVELHQSDRLVSRAETDDSGRFAVRADRPGIHHVRASRLGYQALEVAVILYQGQDTVIELSLAPAAVGMPPLTVSAEADPYLEHRGYYERKRSEAGHFLDPPDVERLAVKAKLTTDMLIHIPGVRLARGENGVPFPQLRSCRTLSNARASGAIGGSPMVTLPAEANGPRVYLDGVLVGPDIAASTQPNDVLAVEVYIGPSQVPLQYSGTDAPCGVILIWTKR